MRLKMLVAGAVLPGLSAQAAAQPTCLTSAEAETVIQTMLPGLTDIVGEQYEPFLPANGEIVARGEALGERYTLAAEMGRDEAASAICETATG